MNIDGFRCKIWYKDQPLECDICHEGHKAVHCPYKGKCLRCRQEGHFVAACPNPPWNLNVSAQEGVASAESVSATSNVAASGPVVISADDASSSMETEESSCDKEPPSSESPPMEAVSSGGMASSGGESPSVETGGSLSCSVPLSNESLSNVASASEVDTRDNQLDELSQNSQLASQSVLGDLDIVSSGLAPDGLVITGSSGCITPLQGESVGSGLSGANSDCPAAPSAPLSSGEVGALAREVIISPEASADVSVVPPPPVVRSADALAVASSSPVFTPPLPPGDRPSRRSVGVSEVVLAASRARSRSKDGRAPQSPSPPPGRHRGMPSVSSGIPVPKDRKKKK